MEAPALRALEGCFKPPTSRLLDNAIRGPPCGLIRHLHHETVARQCFAQDERVIRKSRLGFCRLI